MSRRFRVLAGVALAIICFLFIDFIGAMHETVSATIVERYDSSNPANRRGTEPLPDGPPLYRLTVKPPSGYQESVATDAAGYYYTRVGQRIEYQQQRGWLTGFTWTPTYYAPADSVNKP